MPDALHTQVLIVEDEPIARATMESLLRRSGFSTISVGSAEQALCVSVRDEAPLFALIDLDLPGMNGAELLRRLRAVRPNIQAIIMTAASVERVRRLFGNDVHFLRKPLDFKVVLNLLSTSTGQAR